MKAWGGLKRQLGKTGLNKDESCNFAQSLLINQKFDIHSHVLLDRFTNEFAQAKVQHNWLHVP